MPRGQQDRRAGHAPVELGEGDHRAGEGDGADGDADRHLDDRGRVDRAHLADRESFRRIERTGGDENRREADQRVEGGDQLRHRRHRHAPRDGRTDPPADPQPDQD